MFGAVEHINIYAAWIAIFLGFLSGVIPGMMFHKEDWAGGYSSWSRRLMRLGHISFFGVGFINLAFAFTVSHIKLTGDIVHAASILFIVGQIGMPLICYLSALNKPFRNLFFIPVLSLILGAGLLLFALLRS